jgi:hypothetical protein
VFFLQISSATVVNLQTPKDMPNSKWWSKVFLRKKSKSFVWQWLQHLFSIGSQQIEQ